MSPPDVHRTVEAVFRVEGPRLIAGLTRMLRDVGQAEELAQEAVVAALEHWPRDGVPDNPGAWLTTTARRRALDRLRHARLVERRHDELAPAWRAEALAASEPPERDEVGDELLRLMFVACHPLLAREAQVALTLRLLGGLTTAEIARAFLVPEPTMAQRLVRAKRALSDAGVGFELPDAAARAERLTAVHEVIYLVFNEGYAASHGEEWLRPGLCEDALRLGRVVVGLVPDDGESHGLLALMELQASRAAARVGADGAPVLLLDQDRARWDQRAIGRGLAALARAEAAGGGPFTVQAAIAACHARARRGEDTDWPRIAALYTALVQHQPSPVVELNRAVAFAMAFGPAAGLELVDAIADHPALARYHLLPSVRGDLLVRLGRPAEARRELERAAALAGNERERRLLAARAAACAPADDEPTSSG